MDDDDKKREFHHPYTPYDIQNDFMNAVYTCLENGKIGIFESPTGTGKSLSLICGSLTWLRDERRRIFEGEVTIDSGDSSEPSWMVEHVQKEKRQEALHRKRELEECIARVKEKEERAREQYENGHTRIKRQKLASDGGEYHDETHFILDDYETDDEIRKHRAFNDFGLSTQTQALMEKLGLSASTSKEEMDMADETRIFFCSRTHSQLTQFANELRRVKIPPAVTLHNDVTSSVHVSHLAEDVKHITLGSRKNLCVNSKVNQARSVTEINERCVELQKLDNAEKRCSYMPTKETEALLNDFRNHAMAKIRDIEDLGRLGKKLGICPYYASRPVMKYSEIVTLPYPLLLQKTAREALGISLKDNVVIIDEAHNLMDAIAGIYSVSVTLEQVQQARLQLTAYLQKFRNKLKGKNRVYVAQTVRILDSIINFLQEVNKKATTPDGLVDMGSIMSGKGVDQINIFKLNTYLQESKLAHKVDGYTTHIEQNASRKEAHSVQSTKRAPKQDLPVLMHVQTFLLSLMNPSTEGRFFYSKEDDTSIALRYMLLDPTFHFKDIVEEARAVILAGGTMSPMDDYKHHLLSYLEPTKIMTLSCGHVIPPSSLFAAPVVKASSGADFDFTFETRQKEGTMINLGDCIIRFMTHIPDGVVIFFPSYSYLDACVAAWRRLTVKSSRQTFWESFLERKPVFLEHRSQAQSQKDSRTIEMTVDSVLDTYSAAVASGNGRGALLFAVIGGKLSEGINFSDTLGRGVMVIGLPFPNSHSADWKAKMQYIRTKESKNGNDGKAAAREFYENACMRAVNQCIGRAIRHKGDFAAILMLDKRYGSRQIQDKLPKWIRDSLAGVMAVKDIEVKLDEFFMGRKR